MKVTLLRLKQTLRYFRTTGFFICRTGRGPLKVGDRAGYLDTKDGYRRIHLDGKTYLEQQLAWFYVKGEWEPELDHRNTIRFDNKWKNIRPATRGQNRANSSLAKNNSSGYKGVRLYRSGRYQARLRKNGKEYHLGYFDTLIEARVAYQAGAKQHFGNFARAA